MPSSFSERDAFRKGRWHLFGGLMGTALITGASAGLGVEFAKLFAKDGHDVVLVARRRDQLESVAETVKKLNPTIKAHVIDRDLGTPGSGRKLFDQTQSLNLKIDFLVNNAGFGDAGKFSELKLDRQLQMIDLNIRTLTELTHLYLQLMLQNKFGKILNVGSTAGFQPGPNLNTYYASKAFVNSFSEGLAEELRGTGVTCTVLCPGPTATEFVSVAGVEESLLFKMVVATSQSVAKQGYKAMMRGCPMVVTGSLNKIFVQALRISPRFLVRKITGRLNQ